MGTEVVVVGRVTVFVTVVVAVPRSKVAVTVIGAAMFTTHDDVAMESQPFHDVRWDEEAGVAVIDTGVPRKKRPVQLSVVHVIPEILPVVMVVLPCPVPCLVTVRV